MKEGKVNKKIYYFTPGLLAVILFGSNFLNTNLFSWGFESFTVWFVLSLFAFACGWLINKTLGWIIGGRMVFAVIVAGALMSMFLISFFNEYFSLENVLTENLILFSLRDIVLGLMGFFGMTVAELFVLQRKTEAQENQIKFLNEKVKNVNKEKELIIKEAKLEAEKIILEAEKKARKIIETKLDFEKRLSELITAEKELLKKYENE